MLSQAFLTSIRSRRNPIGNIDSGSDMNPDVANIIYETLTRAAAVINTVTDVGSLGSGNSNWSSWHDVTMQGDSDKLGSQADVDIYMIQVPRTSEKPVALGSDSSNSSFGHMVPQRFYSKVTYDEYTSEYRYLSMGMLCDYGTKEM